MKNGTISDNTDGATHFKTSGFDKKKFEDKGQMGNHYFARDKTEINNHS